MISYRALKKLIGESSLERKCRFLFGSALLLLITASFWLYAYRTQKLVETQQVLAARMLVRRLLQIRHQQLFILASSTTTSVTDSNTTAADAAAASVLDDQKVLVDQDTRAENAKSDSPDNTAVADINSDNEPEKSAGTIDELLSPAPVKTSDQSEMDLLNQVMNQSSRLSDRGKWSITSAANELPVSDNGFEARRLFLDDETPEDEYWVIQTEEDQPRKLIYFAAIRIENGCRVCHNADGKATFRSSAGNSERSLPSDTADERDRKLLKSGTGSSENAESPGNGAVSTASSEMNRPPGDATTNLSSGSETEDPAPIQPLHSIAQIEISLEPVDAQLSRNRAILIATGIVTSFLAMLAAYAIVRYIIVKPVQHLKDVSDEIARGNLNLRADISTGDEFEELSHAFNRMLRHMMTVNDELRSLNDSLDGKIDQLAQANMELFNNNKLKDDFLATISHELRTPLNSILGFSDILQSAVNLDDRQKRYVHNIQTSGQSLMVQINDLLDLAKIESGKMDVHAVDVQLADVLELQMQQIMPLADRKNIDLRIEYLPTPLPVMHQDRSKICQILTNLLSNAIKFTPEGGRVRIASRLVDSDMLEFSVEDTGIGIPLQEQEHIFEKFRQGSTVPGSRDHVKREYEGTGLGLSIVRELARLLGGDVSLRSEFGKGSLFTVRLPIAAPQKKKPEPSEPQLESRSSAGLALITAVDLLPESTANKVSEDRAEVPLDVQSI